MVSSGLYCIENNLLLLFSQLTVALSGVSANWMNIYPYLNSVQIPNGAAKFLP
jgi:hypothetical protein